MTKKLAVKKAIEAIDSGDARGLRRHINEALVTKVRKALDKKEKVIARNLIETATKTSLHEESSSDTSVLSSIKKVLKSKDQYVVDPGAEYLARIASKTKGQFYHVGLNLVTDANKSVWIVYDQSITVQGSKTQKLAKPLKSTAFDSKNPEEKTKNLEKLLQDVVKGISSGQYDSQEPSF